MSMPQLFNHQKQAVDFITARGGSGALFHEMGLGKTRSAIEILSDLRKNDPHLKMLVVCPISLLEAAWHEDIDRFSDFKFCNLRIDAWVMGIKSKPSSEEDDDIFAVNYEFFLSKEKVKNLISFIGKFNTNWIIVLDESSRIKNPQAATTKMLLALRKFFKHAIIMSGTPAPNSDLEYWPQMQFVEPGLLGNSLTVFRATYFHLRNRYTGAVMPSGRFTSKQQAMDTFRKCDYAITQEKRRELFEIISPVCHMAKKIDCLDLPEQIDELRVVEMEKSQAFAYRELERHLVLEIQKEVIAVPVALTKLMKLRQLTSGFIYNALGQSLEISKGGELLTNKVKSIAENNMAEKEFNNPKLNELFDVIEEAGEQQVIIWIQFHWEQIKICHELFKKYGEKSVVTISSLTKDRDESIKAFKEGDARFLVAHPASAAHGLTFVNCHLQIFFSLDYSYEKHEQARARVHRAGQKNVCTYVYLLCKGTIDEIILKALRTKGDAQKMVYDELVARHKK